MRIDKPLWHEGLILNQQQFQQQERWTDFVHRQFASSAIAEPWGTLGVEIDEEALPNDRLKLTRLKFRFPDGTLFDTSVSDALPSARDLTQSLSPDTQSVVVLAALPLMNAMGSNCRFVSINLTRKRPTTWKGQVLDEQLVGGADYYLSVNAAVAPFELVERFPKLCKIGAPDDVEHIVNSALAGIPLKAVQRVPAAIPVRLDNLYFALDPSDAAHARMLAARACQIYLPTTVTDPALELYAVLRS
jgi:predicted component of type VI protein secretion system